MKWAVAVHPDARKYLKRIPRKDYRRIEIALEGLQYDPHGGDVERLEGGEDIWRRRVGAYRIFYEIRAEQQIVFVFNIERRTSATY